MTIPHSGSSRIQADCFSISQLASFPPHFSNNLHALPAPLKDQVWACGDGV